MFKMQGNNAMKRTMKMFLLNEMKKCNENSFVADAHIMFLGKHENVSNIPLKAIYLLFYKKILQQVYFLTAMIY